MFYVLERSSQLPKSFEDCFVRFIPKNNNFHPALTTLSLIYIRPLSSKKGYIICLDHTESFSINQSEVINWLLNNTGNLWVLDKKEALHWVYPLANKLFDAHLLDFIDLTEVSNTCINYYYNKFTNLPNVNCLIPISKHYEESEAIFQATLPTIQKYDPTNTQFQFQNFSTSHVFYQIEKNGIKVDKNCFIDYYNNKLNYPEFNLYKGKIYTQYNLYTTTTRPSNTCNSINFAALNKEDGERQCYRPENNEFIELDFQGYHPRLIGDLINFPFLNTRNTYDTLATILEVTPQEAKELTFKQLYGGVWKEYQNKPFFKDVITYMDDMWNTFQCGGFFKTQNKIFIRNVSDKITQQKLFNYVIQSYETSNNVVMLEKILKYLENKKTKLVLYTYDAFLFDYSKDDGKDILQEIISILHYPVTIKQGKTYHGLIKI